MDIIIAIILGIVEGVTEFLPISSTGHLIVTEKLLGFHDVQDMFTVVIQLGAILAVIWFYWRDLLEKTLGLFRWDRQAVHFWKLLVTATIPAGIIGLLLNDSMDKLTKPVVVATTLIIGGVILWLVDRKPVEQTETVADFSKISLKKALLVGLGQSVAIIPGVSRSGATIVTGLATGLNRPTATALSFYLSIPVMVLASGLKLVQNGDQLSQLSGGPIALFVGLVTAFITALFSIKWLLKYISHHNFKPFAYYRIIVGVLIFVLLAVNVL
ncbi:undecaprenyl-diphosphate phosphatase [Candidatus Saccharibacteria bacterium]|nr:undecaprenyl-diphosphate phosphatase [Candidatus Saccharibacteria bacterium]